MATTDDGQLQKQVPGEPPPQTGNDPPPATQDEQLQIPIPHQPPPVLQTNNDPIPCCTDRFCDILYIVFLVFIGVLFVYLLWAAFRPGITVYVESASLTSFNLSSSNTLHHILSVELSMMNPVLINKATYTRVETNAYYDGNWFQWAPLDDFYLGYKKTTVLRAVMAGATPLDLGASGVELYRKQRKAGAFDLEVRFQGKVKYNVRINNFRYERTKTDRFRCFLAGVRLGAAGGFVRTKCKRSHFYDR